MKSGETVTLIWGIVMLVMLMSSLLSRQTPWRHTLRMSGAWLGIFALLFTILSYRTEIAAGWSRVSADFLGKPHEAAGGTVRLPRDPSGHFIAKAEVNGHSVTMLVDTGATDTVFPEAMARDLGADCLATGHYVRRLRGPAGCELHRAADPARDQSYFLYATTEAQLEYLRFPLGGLPKQEVRRIAESAGLRVAAKPDSQDICFVPDGDYASIVRKLRPEAGQPGDIVHSETGEMLGRHRGVIHYTIGQRRGLEIGGQTEPLYVTGIDAATHRVLAGPRRLLAVSRARLTETNRIGPLPDAPLTAKVRSLAKPAPVALEGPLGDGAETRIRFLSAEYGVAPGQAAVLYAGDRVLGGGWIAETSPD